MYKTKEKRKEYARIYYLKNRNKIIQRNRKHYQENRDEIIRRGKEYRHTSHGKAVLLAKKFGISFDEASKFLEIKECEICGNSERLAIDHNHRTGKIRGRLCWRCNRAMGAFKDSSEILQRAVDYLKKNGE